MRNIFLEKPYTKCGRETIPRLLFRNLVQFVFITCQIEGYQNISKVIFKTFTFTLYKAFFKKSGTNLSALYSA